MSMIDAPLNGHNLAFVEALYARYLEDPASVDEAWRAYFQAVEHEDGSSIRPTDIEGPHFQPGSIFNPPQPAGAPTGLQDAARQDRVDQLVRAYRVRGHMVAQLDPLGLPRSTHPELDISYYGFTEADLDQSFSASTLSGPQTLTLREIIALLKETYCGHIGVQFMHIDDLEPKNWLQSRMERSRNRLKLSRAQQLRVLSKLTEAEIFEQFIHRKFLGAKRFSLEGGESLIPLLDLTLEKAGEHGLTDVIFAMAHRGRLNVLANILAKPSAQIFREFADKDPERYIGGGDVKYHLGYSSDHHTTAGQLLHLSLCFNPSHLEFVGPVLAGRVRAKQDRMGDAQGARVLPILIHGDAAFAGQGIVQEMLNFSELPGYRVGGTVHIIVNNQIGFTTSPEYSRSSAYATDVAKMLQIPILHVNGEDPEAVAQVVELAMEFRRKFHKDVVIDMWCYRRYGHNEGDEPAFTQPVMYRAIRARKTVREGYLDNLLKLNEVSREEADEIVHQGKTRLEHELSLAQAEDFTHGEDHGQGLWQGYRGGRDRAVADVETGVARPALVSLLESQQQLPEGFSPHPNIKRFFAARLQMAHGERPLDWGAAESLAFATLLSEGTRVRVSGQDSGRGTFSHRHAVLHDAQTGDRYIPLNNLSAQQGVFDVVDSPLSENAVLGFEYGYSLDYPDGLVIWEAQFGDFANGAQVIIDQFIVSSEDKWQRLNAPVMLLPHAFEGQGPEHSSARLERFLSLCAEDNIQVVYPTTPAQIFHLLRRQVRRPIRKPLVVMSPKSLLRLPEATSSLEDLATGGFQRILPDTSVEPAKTRRVLLCSGKVYYDLAKARTALGEAAEHVAIHRIEQLYPLRPEELQALFAGVPEGTQACWVQEEPANQGAWPFMRYLFGERLFTHYPLQFVGRPESASPATGSLASHKLEQEQLLEQAFKLD